MAPSVTVTHLYFGIKLSYSPVLLILGEVQILISNRSMTHLDKYTHEDGICADREDSKGVAEGDKVCNGSPLL